MTIKQDTIYFKQVRFESNCIKEVIRRAKVVEEHETYVIAEYLEGEELITQAFNETEYSRYPISLITIY